jgi:hypothetical protein
MNDHEVIDRNGKKVTRGDILQDGDRMIVRMNMMDGADPAIAALASAAALADSVRRLEQFDARNHRPGFATRDAATSTTIEKALADRDARLNDAWKNPPSVTVEDSAITAIEKVAVVGPSAGNDALFAARDRVISDRDKRTAEAWKA